MKSLDNIKIKTVKVCYRCMFFSWTPGNPPICTTVDRPVWQDIIPGNPREERPEWCPLPILIEGE